MSLVWNWPQIVWAVLAVLSLIIWAALNGQPMTGKYNFPLKMVGLGITIFILYSGGFWAGAAP